MLEPYKYYCPTRIFIQDNGINDAGKIIKDLGYKKVFIIYGGQSLVKSGNYDLLIKSLKENNVEFQSKGGVRANPEVEFIRHILPTIKEYKPDLILAVGGGSVIDTAKNICVSYYYDGDPLDFNKWLVKPSKKLPLGTILTLAAAGSEMSNSCVISEDKTNFKQGFNSDFNRPDFSILDPKLTLTVPAFQTFAGLVDIISHSFERYFSPSSNYELCDEFALSVIKQCVEIAPVLLNDPSNLEARRSMMITSTCSHNGWTSFGKSKTNFICHKVEHEMSGHNPKLTHGLGLRFLLGEFLEINKDVLKDKIIHFGKFVFDIDNDVDKSIKAFKSFLDSLPLSKSMLEEGFTKEEEIYYLNKLKLN